MAPTAVSYTQIPSLETVFLSFISISRTAPLLLNQVESLPNEAFSIRRAYRH